MNRSVERKPNFSARAFEPEPSLDPALSSLIRNRGRALSTTVPDRESFFLRNFWGLSTKTKSGCRSILGKRSSEIFFRSKISSAGTISADKSRLDGVLRSVVGQPRARTGLRRSLQNFLTGSRQKSLRLQRQGDQLFVVL